MREIIVESIGYGLFDARIEGVFQRGVGGSRIEAANNLLERLLEEGVDVGLENNTEHLALVNC